MEKPDINDNWDDLFDNKVKNILKNKGYIFPEADQDFELIEQELIKSPLKKPTSLLNPIQLLDSKSKTYSFHSGKQNLGEYQSSIAQAAREGGEIPEDIKKQMENDKEISR